MFELESVLNGCEAVMGIRQIYSDGLVLNGGFVEKETPHRQTIITYHVMGEINAGNFLARRSLEDMRSTERQYEGVLEAANQGAIPSEGPSDKEIESYQSMKSMR